MKVGPEDRSVDAVGGFDEVMVVVPVNADVEKAQEVTEKNRNEGLEIGPIRAVRYFKFQHHDGDDDGENAVAERFKAVLFHGAGLPIEGEGAANRKGEAGEYQRGDHRQAALAAR